MSTGWENVSASHGGTVAGLAVADPGMVFAATSVGVYRSSDGGTSWSLPGTSPTVPFASAVAVSPRFASDRAVFACGADGLYRSSDAGQSWQRLLVGGRMFSVVVAADGLTVLVATEEDGILRSEDGGNSWTGANAGLLDLTVLCLALSPGFETDRTAFAGSASGLYRTRNGGRSWRSVEMGVEDPAVQCIGVSPDFGADRLVLAGTEASGLLRSTDGGATWTSVASGGVNALAFRDGRTVAAATDDGLAISNNGGESWSINEDSPSAPALSLVFAGDTLLAGLHRGGVMRSGEVSNSGLSARLDTSLVVTSDGVMFISGLEQGIRVSRDGGGTWEEHNAGLEDVAIHGLAASATTVWVATPGGVYADGARGWKRCAGVEGPALMIAASARVVVAALEGLRLARSDDEGATWRMLGAPRPEDKVVALSVARDGTLFVGTATSDEVTLWRRADRGEAWQRWLVERASGVGRVALCAVDSEIVFFGLGATVFSPLRNTREVRGRERRPLWRSAELAPEVVAITSLTSDSDVFATTNAGVFVSRDRGATFQNWSDGLTNKRMVALAVSPTFDVYSLGLGGTTWRRSHPAAGARASEGSG